jgi:hypothetical protein
MSMNHDQAREKVCAICTNEYGFKVCRNLSKEDERMIKELQEM